MELTANARIEGPISAFVDPVTIGTGTVIEIKRSGFNPGVTVRWDGESRTRTYRVDAYPATAWTIIG